jgi:hypothetical protein
MPVGQGARNNIILGGLGRPNLFDTNVKATSIDEDIFTDQEVITAAADGDLVLVLDVSETPDKIKYITKSNFIGEGLVAISGNVDNRLLTATGSAVAGEANLLYDGTILTNDGGEVNIDISGGDPHLSFQIAGTDEFTIGVDDDDSDSLKIDTGGTVGGATKLTLDTSGNMTLAGALTVTGNILPAADDTHDIGSASAAFQDLFLEGDITLTDAGTIATSAGDLTVDAEGDIILDANGANVTFKDDGTSILDIANSSTDVEITVSTADKNLKFKGTDGSSAITALDIDMAAAGAATFNGDVVVGALLKMPSNTASKILVADGSSFEEVAVGDLSEITSIANDDVFIAIDTTDGALKKVSRSQVVSGLATSGAISDVVDDSSPQLGGDLDVNSNGLVSTSNGNIALTPNGSGVVRVDGSNGIDMESGAISIKNAGAESYVRFYCEVSNAHYTQLQASPHSAYSGNVTVVLPAAATNLVGDDTTQTLTNKTLTSPVINTGTFGTSILPVSANGTTLGSATKEFSDLFLADGGQILFGNDQEITLTHVADDGLVLKHVGTADGKEPSFSFHAGDNDIAANDVLGSIFFKAPDEGAGTDAVLVAAGIEAVSEGNFAADNNATKLSFLTGASEAAAEKMSLSSGGNLTIAGDLTITGDDLFMNTNTAGHILVGDDTNYNPVAVSGDIGLASNGAMTIQAGAVEHGMLADDIISGQAEITTGLAAADELMYSDAGTVKRIGLDTLATKLFSVASAGTVAQASDHMLFLDNGATGDVIVESIDDFLSAIAGSGVSVSSSQLTVAAGSDTVDMGDGFVIEDGDGTEVTITENKEIKFVEGGGIDINFTDTDNGTDGDPFDLTFTIDAAQTGITSIHATDLIIGEDAQTAIDFGTANEIDFKVDNANRLTLDTGALYPATNNQIDLGTSSLEFKDAFFDGTVTADAFAGPLTGNVTGNVSGTAATVTGAAQSNITSLGTLTTLTVDNVITNGTTIGHTDDTDLMTVADGLLTVAGEVSMTTLDIGGTNVGSTAGELNLLDGSAKSTSSITIADADAFIVIDGSTTKQIPASDIKTYAAGSSATKGFATAMAIAL